MPRFALAALGVLLAVGPGCGRKDEARPPAPAPPADAPAPPEPGRSPFFDYTPPDGRFRVSFPWQAPAPQPRTNDSPFGPVADTLLEVRQGGLSASVTHADFDTPQLARVNLERVIDAGRDAVARALNGTPTRDVRTDFPRGHFVRDVTVSGNSAKGPRVAYLRWLVHRRRLYTLVIMGDGQPLRADDRDRFFNSFRVLR